MSFQKGNIPWNKNKKGVQAAWNKGRKCPQIASAKLGKKRPNVSGKNHWCATHKVSDETKKKMSIAKIGKKHTKEHNQKISKKSLKNWENEEYRKKVLGRRPMSYLEIKFNNIIKKNHLPYKFVGNGKFFIERKNPDFINCNGEKIAIEVFGSHFKEMNYGSTENYIKERRKIFKKYGWDVLFFDETQINEQNILSKIGDD